GIMASSGPTPQLARATLRTIIAPIIRRRAPGPRDRVRGSGAGPIPGRMRQGGTPQVMLFGFLSAIAVMASLAVLGVLAGVASLICWVLFLPFRLPGLVFRGLAFLLSLPFALLLGGGLILAIGIPLVATLLLLAAPAILLGVGIVWLAKRAVSRAAV